MHTPSSTSSPRNRHHLALVVPPHSSVLSSLNGLHQACAVNGDEDDEEQQEDEHIQLNRIGTLSSSPTLPHLWADSSPVSLVHPSTSTSTTMEGPATGMASIDDDESANRQASEITDTYAPLYAAMDSHSSTVPLQQPADSHPAPVPSSLSSWRSPSSCSIGSTIDQQDHLNRFSLTSTVATSEGCHNLSHQQHPLRDSLTLNGADDVNRLTKQHNDADDDASSSMGHRKHMQSSQVNGAVDRLDNVIIAPPSDTASTANPVLPPENSTMQDSTSVSSTIIQTGTHRRDSSAVSSSHSITSTCSAVSATGSTSVSSAPTGPVHKRSFLSAVLSRSPSLSGQSRTEARHHHRHQRSRTVSTQSGSGNMSIDGERLTGVVSSGANGSSTSLHRQLQHSNEQQQHTRHMSNPTARHSSSPSATSSSSSTFPYAMITPASPLLPPKNTSDIQAGHGSTTTTTTSSTTGSLESDKRTEKTTMRRSSRSLGPFAPLPNDSVFSTATRAYIDDNDNHSTAQESRSYDRAASPSPSYQGSSTPSSRAARYLSRHFSTTTTTPPSSASAAGSGLSTPFTASVTGGVSSSRFADAQEAIRRSPTSTRFFSAASTAGGDRSNTRNGTSGTPLLSSSTNQSSSSLTNGSTNNKDTKEVLSSILPSINNFGLALNPLSTQMSISRSGQPLCGAVLDGKYLLIGTSLGLDFLPLHIEGNKPLKSGLWNGVSSSLSERFGGSGGTSSSPNDTTSSSQGISSSSSGNGNGNGKNGSSSSTSAIEENNSMKDGTKKVRKPISLIKKTRFKQLVILSERSNVLLAVAGRNDHVRVYSLDSLRRLIEKKMKDIVDSPSSTSATSPSNSKPNKGLGLSMQKKGRQVLSPVPPLPGDIKGKGRALPMNTNSSTTTSSTQQTSNQAAQLQSQTMRRQYSPPPAYEHGNTTTNPTSTPSPSSSSHPPNRRRKTITPTSVTEENNGHPSPTSATATHFPPASSPSSSVHRSSPHSPREHVASSPRGGVSMRRAKSRETLRRGSSASSSGVVTNTIGHHASSSSAGYFPRAMSRRGSAATVTPDNYAGSSAILAALPSPTLSSAAGRRRASVATIVPTSPSVSAVGGGQHSIHTTITRRGSTAQLADMGQVTSEQHTPRFRSNSGEEEEDGNEESYEWVDAPGNLTEDEDDSEDINRRNTPAGYSFPLHPAAPWSDIPAMPPLPEEYASSSASVTTFARRGRSASNISNRSARARMTPRSPRVRIEIDSDEEVQKQQEQGIPSPQIASSASTRNVASTPTMEDAPCGMLKRSNSIVQQGTARQASAVRSNRRVSLAEILRETGPSLSRSDALSRPSIPSNASFAPMPSSSRFTALRASESAPTSPAFTRQSSGSGSSRFVARSAVADSPRSAMADLADFLNNSAPPEISTSASTSTDTGMRMSAPMLRRAATSTSIPDMEQVNRSGSPVTTSMLSARSPSLGSFSNGPKTPRFVPREASTSKIGQAEIEARDSLMDLLREGPPDVRSAQDAANAPISPGRQGPGKKLQKGQYRSTMSLQSNASARSAPAPVSRRSASVTGNQASAIPDAPAADVQADTTVRYRTRSDGATLHRGGNYILPADEIVPVPVSVTTPAPMDPFSSNGSNQNKNRKRRSMQPRSPTFRHFIAEIDTQPTSNSTSGTTASVAQMTRGLSLQEMLASGGIDPSSDNNNSPVLGSEDDTAFAESVPSRHASTAENDTGRTVASGRNRRNRWSLLAGLRSSANPPEEIAPSQVPGNEVNTEDLVATNGWDAGVGGSQANLPLPERHVVTSVISSVSAGLPPILKPRRPEHLLEDDSPPFGNLTPDMQQQIANGATDPDGTTIMFTQQTSRASANGNVTSVATALGNPTGSASNGIKGNPGMQKGSSSGNLEYVKLARTRGSRFIRASETEKRTYLAVLCGEQGERIELFTGAKSVSLSLNRTFVLPETPRTIEFQLQGEDLLDLYLIYDSAIFALEPSTVRVREVGIQRNERRQARREREQQLRQAGALDGIDTSMPPPSPSSPNTRLLHARQVSGAGTDAQRPIAGDSVVNSVLESETMPNSSDSTSRAPSRATSRDTAEPSAVDADAETTLRAPVETTHSNANVNAAATASSISRREASLENATSGNATTQGEAVATPQVSQPAPPYTTFQQLEYLPQIPPSVLASSYVIPPTYETVLSASPNPEVNMGMFINSQLSFAASSPSPSSVNLLGNSNANAPEHTSMLSSPEISRSATPSIGSESRFTSPSTALLTPDRRSPTSQQQQQQQYHGQTPPLLSPVSLLANPSARNIGPPGLFFVSKGRNSTGIVDGDGRSVIKKPIVWLGPDEEQPTLPEQYEGLNHFSRMEIILTSKDKTRVCIAAFGPTSVRAIELGHPAYSESIEIIPPEALKRQQKSMNLTKGMRASGKEVPEELVFVRDVAYLAKEGQCTFFAERVGGNVAIYSLGSAGYTFH